MLTIYKKLADGRCGKDESGSVIVALVVIVVVALGLAVTLTHVNSGLNSTRVDQNRTNAFQLADAGMDQALYRIDTGAASSFTDSLVVGTSTFAIVATRNTGGRTWTVRSTGTDTSGRQRRVVATIRAESLFSEAFFTIQEFRLTGLNDSTPVAYDSTICPAATASCELPRPIAGRLGTNGTISGSASTSASFRANWQGFNMYGRTNQADADDACMDGNGTATSGCGTDPQVAAITNRREVDLDKLSAPAGALPCPNGGTIGANGQTTTIAPGDYTCANLNLRGTIVVGGTGNVRFWPTSEFSAASGALVNQAQPTSRFQVYFRGQNPPAEGGICGATIWALLYTPGLSIDCNGSNQPTIYGAVVAKIHRGTGNQFDFHWDSAAIDAVHTGKYVIRDWRECPATQNDC